MTQGLAMADEHPTRVRARDPAARRGKRAFDQLSASAIGLEFGVAVLVGALVGHWLDGRFGTEPWLMIAFIALGFVAGVLNVIRGVRRAERAAEDDERG